MKKHLQKLLEILKNKFLPETIISFLVLDIILYGITVVLYMSGLLEDTKFFWSPGIQKEIIGLSVIISGFSVYYDKRTVD